MTHHFQFDSRLQETDYDGIRQKMTFMQEIRREMQKSNSSSQPRAETVLIPGLLLAGQEGHSERLRVLK